MSWLKQNKVEVLFLVLFCLAINILSYISFRGPLCFSNIADGLVFGDPDDYMRLVRMHEWFSGGGFFDTTIARANSPFGGDMHWTRFYDLFWFFPVKIVEFFVKDIKTAVAYVGFVISPIFAIFSSIIFFRLMQYLMEKRNAFIASALFLGNNYIIIQTTLGRPDYHAFLIFMVLLYTLMLTALVMKDFKSRKLLISTAIVTSLCIYASPETLIPLLLSELILFAFSFKNEDIFECLKKKNKYTFIALFALFVLNNPAMDTEQMRLLVLNMICVFGMSRREEKTASKNLLDYFLILLINIFCFFILWKHADYDKLSLVHVILYFDIAMFYKVSSTYNMLTLSEKLKRFLIIGSVFFVMFSIVCPKFFLGMEANVDAYAKKVWLTKVEEMQSPLSGDFFYSFLFSLVISIMACLYKTYSLYREKKYVSRETIVWTLFLTIGFVYTIFGCMAFRMISYSVIFTTPIVVDFIMNGKFFAKFSRVLRLLFAIWVFFTPQLLLVYASNKTVLEENTLNARLSSKEKSKENFATNERDIYKLMDALSDNPVTILASINVGPRLLWFTKHRIVASPYHRHTNGIIAEYEILRNKFNAETVKKYLLNTKTEYILIDKKMYFRGSKECCKNSLGYYLAKYADYNGWMKSKESLSGLIPAEILNWIEIVPLEQIYKKSVGNSMEKMSSIVVAKVLLSK